MAERALVPSGDGSHIVPGRPTAEPKEEGHEANIIDVDESALLRAVMHASMPEVIRHGGEPTIRRPQGNMGLPESR